MIKVIKNRLSRDDIAIGLLFMGNSGTFKELPPPDLMKESDYEWCFNVTK